MNPKLKRTVQSVLAAMVSASQKTGVGRYIHDQIVNEAMSQAAEVHYSGISLKLSIPNIIGDLRAKTFATKEPETLEWIDAMPEGSTLWDIGANAGLYSVYAAKRRHCRVWAFEPSVFNLEMLARNIFLNHLEDLICIVPLALSDSLGASQMRMTTTEWGGAESSFGHELFLDGHRLRETFRFQTIGMTMVDVVEKLEVPPPEFIKIDVDGIEPLILEAGASILRDVKGLLVETNDDFPSETGRITSTLSDAGLVLHQKRHSEMFEDHPAWGRIYNQIWIRP
jgi:FkbM family methyltransferase